MQQQSADARHFCEFLQNVTLSQQQRTLPELFEMGPLK